MPSRFDECLSFIRKWEGGKVDDPADPGGRTAYGVTADTYTRYRLKIGRPVRDVFDIEEPEIRDIYLSNYWSPLCCSMLPMGLDLQVFNAGVNAGNRRAGKWLQEALGMANGEIDGIIGQGTLRVVHDVIAANEVDRVMGRFSDLLRRHYTTLAVRNETLQKFLKGWLNRLEDCDATAKECRA